MKTQVMLKNFVVLRWEDKTGEITVFGPFKTSLDAADWIGRKEDYLDFAYNTKQMISPKKADAKTPKI